MCIRDSRLRERFSNRIGIKWGLFSGFAAFAAIILVMLWVFQIMFLGSFYKFIKVSDIKNSAQTIERNINSDDLSTLIQNIARDNQICIIVSDEYGDLFYSEDALPNCVIHRLNGCLLYTSCWWTEGRRTGAKRWFNISPVGESIPCAMW